ncbi:sodium/hydrogen exchanger 8 isoform X2 [Carassius gibelio]|uniref:sodium/hydrogen exchanger 8 isoform X2 n=1 Tax=Carassius gibelio TaxID=101364 RepID=UPI0022775E68|nr:sodium/hydrogen exchanger 8 isoform X2 [Carassius gibelio]
MFMNTMSFRNRAVVIAVFFIILTVDLGRFAAADDETNSKNDKESASYKDVSDVQHENTADGDHQSRLNDTESPINETLQSTTPVAKAMPPEPPRNEPILPEQTGVKAQEEEQSSGMSIFFSLLVIGICIILVHLLIKFKLHFLPESVAVVSLGILMGAVIKIIESQQLANWKEEEMFRPNMFFLLLLPPIIFESGYSLHKGNFFQNIGSITLFAVFGTAISAFIVGGGIYFLGQADVIYKMSMTDSFAFGSLISAVDPVATIAIFNALNVDPVLNMLVFGESILNDAVSIVLTNTAEGFVGSDVSTGWETFVQALGYFLKMFFGSAALGTLTGLISAIALKHFDMRKTPSLEFGMMIIFAYLPYGLAEGIKLSGIMAILFSGIVMSHYTHHNLSPVTQILMQQTLRTVAFMCETCVFAFLGLSIFSFPHKFELSFVIWCIGNAIESEHLSELTEEEYEAHIFQRQDLKGFLWLDAKYLNPFFTRRLTQEDLLHGRIQMKTLTNKWYEEVRQGPSGSEDEDDEAELL